MRSGSYADVLLELGQFDQVQAVLDRAAALAERDGIAKAQIDLTWSRAHLAAGQGDARATERLLAEVDRGARGMDWFTTHVGLSFLLDAAELLDRVGVGDQAQRYFERGRELGGEPTRRSCRRPRCSKRARGSALGAGGAATARPGQLAREATAWRHTLLTAWATFRAGRDGAGELAALAFDQAVACGGVRVIEAGEPEIGTALAPLAEQRRLASRASYCSPVAS